MNCQFIQLRVTFACTRQSRAGTVSGTHLTSGGTVRRGSRAAVGEQGALRCHVIRERFFLLEAVQEVVFGTQLVRVLAQVVVQLARSCGFAGYVARVVRLVLKVSESARSLRRADVRPRLPPALHWLLLPLHGPGAGGGQRRGGGGHARRERRSEGASGGEGGRGRAMRRDRLSEGRRSLLARGFEVLQAAAAVEGLGSRLVRTLGRPSAPRVVEDGRGWSSALDI